MATAHAFKLQPARSLRAAVLIAVKCHLAVTLQSESSLFMIMHVFYKLHELTFSLLYAQGSYVDANTPINIFVKNIDTRGGYNCMHGSYFDTKLHLNWCYLRTYLFFFRNVVCDWTNRLMSAALSQTFSARVNRCSIISAASGGALA